MNMRRRIPTSKRSFSLLEVLVVILLIMTAASVVSFNAFQLLSKQNYTQSVETVYSELAHLQLVSLMYRSDSRLDLAMKDGKAKLTLHTPEKNLRHLNQKEISLKGVTGFKLGKKKVDQIQIQLFSDGSYEPQIPIALIHDEEIRWIDLSTPIQINIRRSYSESILLQESHAPNKPSLS